MIVRIIRAFCLGVALLAFAQAGARVAWAAPVLGTDDFDDGLAHGWQVQMWDGSPADGNLSVPLAGGDPNGYLQVYYASSPSPVQQLENIFNNDANHIGNYSNTLLRFDFRVAPVAGDAVTLNVYFVAANSNVWYNQFFVQANTWTPVGVSFLNSAGWNSVSGGDFSADITTVSEIGVQLNHFNANGSTFTYGLDNWTTSVPVPEPSSGDLAVIVLLSLLVTFRNPIRMRIREWTAPRPG